MHLAINDESYLNIGGTFFFVGDGWMDGQTNGQTDR